MERDIPPHGSWATIHNETLRCFSVLNSPEVADLVNKYNAQARNEHKLPLRHCDMETWDFARLYTNIPLRDLLDRLFLVAQRCFARASRTHKSSNYN